MKRHAKAHWKGSVTKGSGRVSAESGALSDQPYGFNTRFADGIGTNPEELLGAAHASCFAMALSMVLGESGFTPDSIDAYASVSLEEEHGGLTITEVHLEVRATVPGVSREEFEKCVNEAGSGCPVSRLFNAEVTLEARLED